MLSITITRYVIHTLISWQIWKERFDLNYDLIIFMIFFRFILQISLFECVFSRRDLYKYMFRNTLWGVSVLMYIIRHTCIGHQKIRGKVLNMDMWHFAVGPLLQLHLYTSTKFYVTYKSYNLRFSFPQHLLIHRLFFYCYTFLFLLLLKYDFERGGFNSSIAFRNHFLNNFVLKNTPFFIFFYPIHRHVPGSYYFSNRSFCNFFFQSFVFFISTLKRNSFEWTFYQLQNNPASRQCFSHALFFKRKKFAIFFVLTIIPPSPFNSADIFTSKSFAITRRSKIQFVKLEVKTAI